MLKTIKYLIISAIGALMLFSCSHEVSYLEERGEGLLRFNFDYDLDAELVTKAENSSLVFKIDIVDMKKDVIVKHWEDHRDIENGQTTLRAGQYKVVATCGSDVAAAFDAPYYYGEDVIDVVVGQEATANIVCTLANVKVTVSVSDSVKLCFKKFPITISNLQPGGDLIFEGTTLSNVGYFHSTGTLMWTIVLTNTDGSQVEQPLSAYVDNVKPRQHYHFHFDVRDDGQTGQGAMSIRVTIDGTLVDQEHNVDISLNKDPMPKVNEANGMDIDKTINIPQGVGVTGLFNVTSVAGVEKAILTHNSDAILALGIPKSIDLLNTYALEYQAQGLTWTEGLAVGSNGFSIDFRTLFSEKLALGTYTFKINILDKQAQYVTANIVVKVIPNTEVTTVSVDAWGKFAYVYAQYNTETQPDGLGLQYKKTSDPAWIDFTGELKIEGTAYSAKITGLTPRTGYQFRAVTAAEQKDENIIEATTEGADQLPNFSFDSWCRASGNSRGKNILYPNADKEANYFWDSGNEGADMGSETPTSEETSHVIAGSAVKMETKKVLGLVMAGGNIYSGSFGKTIGTSGAEVNFGRPYDCRPLALEGYYDYAPKTINMTQSPWNDLKGQNDIGKIFVVLADWSGPFIVNNVSSSLNLFSPDDPGVIAYGELEDQVGTNGEYKKFRIDLEYRDNRKPSYVIVVACSSKYADYFTGGEGSTMYIDEFNFIFE